MPDPETTIHDAIRVLLRRKGSDDVELGPQTLINDVLDSLEVAELSAILEDSLGRDPYSQNVVPRTVAALVGWYNS